MVGKGIPIDIPEPVVGRQAIDPTIRMPGNPHAAADRVGAFEYGKLAINSMITTCGGALLAFLAFLGQVHHLDHAAAAFIFIGISFLGAALFCALSTSIVAYLNQAFLAFWGERVWLLWTAVGLGILSLLLLAVGAVVSLVAVSQIVQSTP